MLCERNISVIGSRAVFRIIRVRHDRDPVDRGRILSERIPILIQNVPFLLHPFPDMLGSAFKNNHSGEVRIGILHDGSHRGASLPDVIERSDRNIPKEGSARRIFQFCCEADSIGVILKGDVQSGGIIIAVFARHIAAGQQTVDLPAPTNDRIFPWIDLECSRQS